MKNPLEQAIKSAEAANVTIGGLFGSIGTTDHPRGFVTSAYRNAHRAMQTALRENDRLSAADDVMRSLRRSLFSESLGLMRDAQGIGAEEAARQMRFYGHVTDPRHSSIDTTPADAAAAAIAARVDAQTAAIRALILAGVEDSQIVGDEDRAGVLRPADIAAFTASLAATLVWSTFGYWAQSRAPGAYQKQAVAGLDERTTQCCLQVHGQIQPMNEPFHLTGTPRYSEYQDWPDFHWWCRTSAVLYQGDYDLGLTDQMLSSAAKIQAERAASGTGYRHPANAFA